MLVEFIYSTTIERIEVYRLEDSDSSLAKVRFCSQSYFDSLSYDGNCLKFTVNHQISTNDDSETKYLYDEFQLYVDKNFNQFNNYKNILYDFNNGLNLIFFFYFI